MATTGIEAPVADRPGFLLPWSSLSPSLSVSLPGSLSGSLSPGSTGVSPDFSLTVATRVTDASLPAASLTVYTNVYAPGLLASTVSPDTFTAPVTSPSTSSTAFTPAIGSNDAPNSTATSSAPEITGGTVSTGSASFTVTLNVAVSEVSAAYVTVMVFSPAVDESNSETVYSPSPSSAVLPSDIVAVTTIPLRSSASPMAYSVLVG